MLSAAGAAIQREYPGRRDRRGLWRFRGAPRPRSRAAAAGWSSSSARRSATSTPGPRAEFLAALSEALQPGDSLLLGTDLVKDTDRLVRAYDDSAGVTAQFNRNVLAVVNRELDADFDLDAFEHVARWNADEERIEMWLRAERARSGCASPRWT